MMEEAKELHRRLLKFTRGESTDESDVLEVLRVLEKTTITYGILKETKMGHTVGKLRKHNNEKVANLARLLVKSWKSMALSPKPSAPSSTSSTSSAPPSSEGSSSHRIPKKEKTTTRSPTSSGSNGLKPASKPAGATRPSSGPFIPAGLDKVRVTVRTKLKEIFEPTAAESGGSAEEVAVAIEITMARTYNMGFAGENKKDYTAKFRQLSFNLKKNGQLREDILQDMVSADQLINMTAEELATEEKRNEIQKLRDEAFQKARLDWADANEEKIKKQCGIENTKGLFTCGRCKSSKTSNTQKQTRSADEPMTVFVQCHNCGNRWKC